MTNGRFVFEPNRKRQIFLELSDLHRVNNTETKGRG